MSEPLPNVPEPLRTAIFVAIGWCGLVAAFTLTAAAVLAAARILCWAMGIPWLM